MGVSSISKFAFLIASATSKASTTGIDIAPVSAILGGIERTVTFPSGACSSDGDGVATARAAIASTWK